MAAMKSKDLIQEDLKEKLVQAFQSTDENAIAKAFADFAEGVQQRVMEDYNAYQENQDSTILAKRGIHQLTKQETKFYQSWIDTIKGSSNPRQALTNMDIVLPQTIIDNVMDDVKDNHPLLDMIDFENMTVLTKMLFNKNGIQLAQWGKITDTITKELSGAFEELDLKHNKLTAFLPVAKDMLDAGPVWLDSYVRAVLSEAVAYGLEEGIINGDGNNMPIGMNRQIGAGVTVTDGAYPQKTPVVITDLGTETFGKLLATLAQDPRDSKKARIVDNLIFIVNPFDYYKKIMPATTVLLPDGTYKNNILPYPAAIIQSTQIDEGEAILGLAKKYKMGIGTGSKDGKIEYSDEYKFLEDQRYYIIKLLGNGQALDNNAFMLLDISGLQDAAVPVTVKGTVTTKASA